MNPGGIALPPGVSRGHAMMAPDEGKQIAAMQLWQIQQAIYFELIRINRQQGQQLGAGQYKLIAKEAFEAARELLVSNPMFRSIDPAPAKGKTDGE